MGSRRGVRDYFVVVLRRNGGKAALDPVRVVAAAPAKGEGKQRDVDVEDDEREAQKTQHCRSERREGRGRRRTASIRHAPLEAGEGTTLKKEEESKKGRYSLSINSYDKGGCEGVGRKEQTTTGEQRRRGV
jgi:hypothetical protein